MQAPEVVARPYFDLKNAFLSFLTQAVATLTTQREKTAKAPGRPSSPRAKPDVGELGVTGAWAVCSLLELE